jgi:hypothetical protein
VFLSGMDTFICDHFFNKPLDVALVIDPCQHERGFFQWTAQGDRRTRITKGFYLTASRFRRDELELFAAQLEGKSAMPTDPRFTGQPGGYPPLVVQLNEPRQPWIPLAVCGMLTIQLLVVALIAWRVLEPPATPLANAPADRELAEQRKLLDGVIGKLQVAPEGVVQALEEARRKNDELTSANVGLLAQIREIAAAQQKTDTQFKSAQKRSADLDDKLQRVKVEQAESQNQIDKLKEKIAQYEGTEDEGQEASWSRWLNHWKWYATAGAVLCLALIAGWYAWRSPLPCPPDDDPPANGSQSGT